MISRKINKIFNPYKIVCYKCRKEMKYVIYADKNGHGICADCYKTF